MHGIFITSFRYKAWANAELFAALSTFDTQRHPAVFLRMLHTLDHVNVVDRIFQSHLMGGGGPRFTGTNSEVTPGLQDLWDFVRTTDDWYVQFASGASAERLHQRVHFSFTDGAAGTMSCAEMLQHVITHGGYHRGSVGEMLENLGLDSPPDSLTKFLQRHEPERRLAAQV